MSSEFQDLPIGNVSLGPWVAGVIFVIVLALTGWTHVQKGQLNTALIDIEVETNLAEKQLSQMRDADLDAIVVAQGVINDVEAVSIRWSDVVSQLLEVTPLDVFYTSYSASVDGKMNLNAFTDSYGSAAQLISVLDRNPLFVDVFVPSLTQGSSDSGANMVSFGLAFNVNSL
jgi:Tfp pilus assembly protein PilN